MSQVIWNSDIDVYDHNVMPLLIAVNISKYLAIPDLLSFGQVSRNAFKTVNDPAVWVSRLKAMSLWESATIPSLNTVLKASDFTSLEDPLSCLDHIIKYPKAAKLQVIKMFKTLEPYYTELLSNKSYESLRIFKDFLLPEHQAKILNNLLVFNKADPLDHSRNCAHDALESLCEVFENAVLRELEIHYDIRDYEMTSKFAKILISLKNDQTLFDFFLQKSNFDNLDNTIFDVGELSKRNFYTEQIDNAGEISWAINSQVFRDYISEVAETFNQQSQVIDRIFPASLPMMCKVCEELISNQIKDVVATTISIAQEKGLLLDIVPFLYELYQRDLPALLEPSLNGGVSYHQYIKELLDMVFESAAADYMRQEVLDFKKLALSQITTWQENVLKREEETTRSILKLVKEDTKTDLLATFKKVFTISGTSNKGNEENEANYSKMEAKARILSENISLLNKMLSPELVLNILGETKTSLNRLQKFKTFTIINIQNDIYAKMQEVFIVVIEMVDSDHVRPGFEKALQYLQTYNPSSKAYTSTHNETFERPLAVFFELSNMADLIIQMIHLFYREEMILRHLVKNENSILNPALQTKKKLESTVDTFIADGLNVSVDVLVNEIESVYGNSFRMSEYNPPVTSSATFGPTPAAEQAVAILEQNINLLGDTADKSIVDVFQQEMAERFFQIVVKVLKNSVISVVGATNLISDLNLYFDFIARNIKSNKRAVLPLFQSLKKVGNIYLIGGSDSKAIAKLVSDLSKFNGIFSQEEIYEFVQQRKDWALIKRHVEKVLFGFGLVDCCIV